MNYLTAYSRREGGSSLLLQEYLCREVPACFACLCSRDAEESREITEKLLSWNRRFPWHRAAKAPGRFLDRAERELREGMAETSESLTAKGRGGIMWRLVVCVDQELLTLGNGYALYLLSGAFGQGSAKRLQGSFRGCLEPEAGILLAEEDFLESRPPQALAQVARGWEIRTQQQADKRLKELAGSGRNGEEDSGTAVLLLTKESA
ncbi:MAG: hypothetical protein NC432_04155 [Roseburia sp.]|nr:hypothetical protein [Roseburia sp.]MCM1097186.1 hypothetical protein [Ruminococcus flavefaciens]